MEKNFNKKQSLELITRMIENTKSNLGRGSGNYFIASGLATFIASLLVGTTLYLTENSLNSHWLWMIIPIFVFIYKSRCEKRERVVTKVDKITSSIWEIMSSITILLPLMFLLLYKYNTDFVLLFSLIPFIEMFIVSIGIAITGAVISYKPLVIGGMVGVMLSFLTLLMTAQYQTVLWFALWALVVMIIPGVKLNNYAKNSIKNA